MVALVFVDGFDKYGPAGNVNGFSVMSGEWSVTSTPTIVAPLSANGYAANIITGANLVGTLPSSMTRIAGSLRFSLAAANSLSVQFRNAATAAFSIISNSGAIELHTGTVGGALIATGGSFAINTTHVLSFDITIGAAAAYAVYLDGVALFSGTGNTGNAQTSVTNFALTAQSSNATYDDLALFNPADAAYQSSVLTASVVVETQFPNSDTQTQFTNDGNVLWPTGIAAQGVYQATATQAAVAVNSLFLLKVTPLVNCTLNSVSLGGNGASLGASKWRGVAYADSSGSPGALLTSGTEVVGLAANTALTLPLTTPQALTAGTPVWIGFINDTAASNLKQVDATTNLGRRIANTYTAGAPGTAGAMTAGQGTLWVWGNCTGAAVNFASELLNPPLGTAQSQIHSSTVGQEDLYGFPALVTAPSTIYGAAVKGFVAKSDTGARTVSLNMKSGASDSTGSAPSQGLSTSSQWQRSFFDVDPATGLAWTQSGLNAAKSGVSVAS